MGNKSAAAGGRFERWLADRYKRQGWFSDRLRSFKVKGEPDLYAALGGIVLDIQAKERQNLNPHAVLMDLMEAQVEISKRFAAGVVPQATPVVVWKKMRKLASGRRQQVGPTIIAMPLDDYLRDIDTAYKATEPPTREQPE